MTLRAPGRLATSRDTHLVSGTLALAAMERRSSTTRRVCQKTKSFAAASGGSGRPPGGAMYSRNSIPGPRGARSAVMRKRAPKTWFRCSYPTP